MNTKLTRVHLGLGMGEIGVQFDTLDDDGAATSTQRAFVVVADAVLAPVWAAAQVALASSLSKLPLDLPPDAVTTALMQQRTADAAAAAATKRRIETEAEIRRLDQLAAIKRDTVSALAAEAAALDAEIAAKRSSSAIPKP